MKKMKLVLVIMCLVVAIGVVGCDPKSQQENGDSSNASDIKINKIENLAHTKINAESMDITKEELPAELINLANLNGKEPEYIITLSTKTDPSSEEFDLLHDYFLYFHDVEKNTSIKVSASEVGTPLRDYFFEEISNDKSKIAGVPVKISQYEDRYIINLEKGEYYLDIETTRLTEDEMIKVIEEVLK